MARRIHPKFMEPVEQMPDIPEPSKELAATQCNFCGNEEFVTHMGREKEKCAGCGSLRRHRVAFELYRRKGMLEHRPANETIRVLHIAPEYILRKEITAVIGSGYICGDMNPEAYGNAKCLKLTFPKDFDIFPDDYFDYVIHNHVLEHIPGSYKEILLMFSRIIKPWGYHIFSVPGPNLRCDTVEGGEFLTDGERTAQFGQSDHVRMFGRDLPETLKSMPNGTFSWDNISNEDRAAISVGPWSNRFLVWRKGRGKGSMAE